MLSCTLQDDNRHCKFFRWLDNNTCKSGAETAPIVIAKFRRLENEAMLAIEGEKEARASLEEACASLEEAREREKVTKRKAEKCKVAQRIAEEKMNTYKQVLILSWVLFIVFYFLILGLGMLEGLNCVCHDNVVYVTGNM